MMSSHDTPFMGNAIDVWAPVTPILYNKVAIAARAYIVGLVQLISTYEEETLHVQ